MDTWLKNLEEKCSGLDPRDYLLWPRTPVSSEKMQNERIRPQQGVDDYDPADERSRPSQIISFINDQVFKENIPENFSVLDICCGDALILGHIKVKFCESDCYGIDMHKDIFGTHEGVKKLGVGLYNVYMQELFKITPDVKFDIVMMLNTYHGWEWADLREDEKDIPDLADEWFKKSAKQVVLTTNKQQQVNLIDKGFMLKGIGRGESGSDMVVASVR